VPLDEAITNDGRVLMSDPPLHVESGREVAVRPMRPADVPAAVALCRASRWNQTAGEWELFLALAPDGAIVAERAGRVIGTAVTLPYGDRFAWVAMVMVDPDEQGRGVGRSLLTTALANATRVPALRLDATPFGKPLYESLGFTVEYTLARYERRVPVPALERPALVRPLAPGDWSALAERDRAAFGANRLAVLEWCWRAAPEYAWVHGMDGSIDGFVLGRHGHDFEQIGPLVASGEDVARRLLPAALAQVGDRPVCIDAPDAHAIWVDGLLSSGFVLQRPFTRMVRGELRHPGDPLQVYAITGPEFG
jgi:GNAT superfamily N-acetyltransferase